MFGVVWDGRKIAFFKIAKMCIRDRRDPTSSLAFGISAIPAGIIMVDRSTKAFNFINDKVDTVSYTHLTLPTKRIV